ncbi:hypothetical protein JCM12296A_56000 [Desulfosarcina cetonica]|uniref:DNA-primase RepB domain-containing protein n=1 Tax=Desulfosarcina cetonica TaxID=90730 RepID=UPI0006D0443C|nr:DNA-primase RepB domain-containing protein [Desulfosarcina cetonica]
MNSLSGGLAKAPDGKKGSDIDLEKAKQEFRKIFDDKGYSIEKKHPIFDGKRHSLTVNGKANAGWYKIIKTDPGPAGFIKIYGEKITRWISSEHKEKQREAELKAGKGMVKVLDKLEKYFHQYEFGVFKEGETSKEGAVWKIPAEVKNVGYLKAMNAQGKHIFIRPTADAEHSYMFHDDMDREGLKKYHQDANGNWKPGRLVVESSPGNYQVWIKTNRPLSVEEKKYWLGKMNSDPGASPLHRWGRAPGFRNRKEKYRTDKGFPLARFEWIDWRNEAKIPKVELKKYRDASKPFSTPQKRPRPRVSRGASQELPFRSKFYKGVDAKGKVMESEQDFAYMLALLRRGVDGETIKERVRNERSDWENHKGPNRMEHYLEESLKKAQAIVDQSKYRVDINKGEKRIKSVSVSVPKGKNHTQYLDQFAINTLVKEGFSPKDHSAKVMLDKEGGHDFEKKNAYGRVMVRTS